jgi:hypothetical protein
LCEGGASSKTGDQRKPEQLCRDRTCHISSLRPAQKSGNDNGCRKEHAGSGEVVEELRLQERACTAAAVVPAVLRLAASTLFCVVLPF